MKRIRTTCNACKPKIYYTHRAFVTINKSSDGIEKKQYTVGRFCTYCGGFETEKEFPLGFTLPLQTQRPVLCPECRKGGKFIIENGRTKMLNGTPVYTKPRDSYMIPTYVEIRDSEKNHWKNGVNKVGEFCVYCGHFEFNSQCQDSLGKSLDRMITIGDQIEIYAWAKRRANNAIKLLEEQGITIKDIKPKKVQP